MAWARVATFDSNEPKELNWHIDPAQALGQRL